MLDWIFEGIIGWVSGIISSLMDAVSGLFLEALGTDMTAMEEYFPFVTKAYGVMQVMAYAILILIVIWQLFRAFGGPINESENPWHLVIRGSIFGFLIGYAKPIFEFCLDIARAPYTSLMDISMSGEDFTFAGVEQTLTNGLTTIVAAASMVGLILILILLIALGWNYFKLLLETVERYIVVGVLCYTSPLAYSMGASKSTSNVFKSWCRMVGSQLLLLVMNVWFLRGFASSMGQFIGNGGALTTGKGSIFLWMFCALAYLKCAQRFDSYLGSIGLNVAQTGSSMGMELLMAARVITGAGGAAKSAGSVFSKGGATPTGTGAAATGFAAGFASKFNPNSYVRDSVVDGGTRMGFGGGAGFVARAFGGMAARNGATLNSQSVSSVASRSPNASGTIAGDIADRSLGNYMPHMKGFQLKGTQITGGHISTTATTADGKTANVDMYSASQYEKPDAPHSVVTAADGSQWYQMASGEGRGAFYDAPTFGGRTGQQNAGGVDPNQDASHTDTGAQVPGTQTETAGAAVQDGSEMGGAGMPQGMDSSSTDQTGIVPDQSGTILPDGSELAGAEVPADQRDISDAPATEEMQPVGGGIPQGADGIQDEQKRDPAVQSGDLQTESMVPGAQIPSAEKEAGGSGIVAQQTEEGEQSISVPSSEQGSMAVQTPAEDAQFHDAAPVPFGADPHSDEVDAAVGETTAQMPSGDGVIPEQTDTGIVSAPVAGQLQGDDLQGAGESDVPFEEHDSAVPAEQSLDVPQTGSVVNIPGANTAEDGGLPTQEGGLDAGQKEAAVVPAADTPAEMPAFTGDPIGTSDAIVAGETGLEGEREMPVHAPGMSGPDASDAAVQNESGDASVQTETAETHTAGTDIPQFGAGMGDGIHDADHDAASDADTVHTGHEDHHSSGQSNAAGFSGGASFGGYAEAPLVAATFPDAEEGTMLRTVGEGMIEASSPDGGNTLWYNSAFYQEPDAPHSVMEAANGVQWYAMQQQAQAPEFESGAEATQYNQAAFQSFMPGYDGQVSQVDGSHRQDGHFEVRNADGSGTVFYDTARYAAPRGDYQVMEDSRGNSWYAIRGEAAVDRKPVFENGHAVYDDGKLRTVSVETVRYRQTPARFAEPKKRTDIDRKPPRRKT